jgi:hypothetical protein
MRLAGEDGSEERWMIVLAVGCGLVILAGLAMLRALRGRIPEWLITIGLVILLYLASWGPLPVFEAEVGQRVATLGTDLTGLLGDAVLWLAKVLASLPDGLLLAVPFLASIFTSTRRPSPRRAASGSGRLWGGSSTWFSSSAWPRGWSSSLGRGGEAGGRRTWLSRRDRRRARLRRPAPTRRSGPSRRARR